jgi:hypothetical protein
MSTTLLEAGRATQNDFSAAVFKELVMADEMLPLIPFVPHRGMGFTYQREMSIGSFAFIADSGATIAESTGADETITVQNRQAVADFYVQAMAQEFTNEFLKQSLKKTKKAGQVIADKIINGGNITGFTLSSGTIFTQGGTATTPYVDALVAASSYMDSSSPSARLAMRSTARMSRLRPTATTRSTRSTRASGSRSRSTSRTRPRTRKRSSAFRPVPRTSTASKC